MVFVHDAPPSILLAESHGEAKFEVDFLACAQVAASANRSGKGHLGNPGDRGNVTVTIIHLSIAFSHAVIVPSPRFACHQDLLA